MFRGSGYMTYKIIEIHSEITCPFKLMDFHFETFSFEFLFKEFDKEQSDYAIEHGGVTGIFSVAFNEEGLNVQFPCDVTVGNVYSFFVQLKECYGSMNGAVVLEDYSKERVHMEVIFYNSGQCEVDIEVANYSSYNSCGKIKVNFQCDQSYWRNIIDNFNIFFTELARLQGYYDFKY